MTTANHDLKAALFDLGMKGSTTVKGTTVNKALADRITRARQRLAAKGAGTHADIDYLIGVFGPEAVAGILEDLLTKSTKEADVMLTGYKARGSVTALKARVADLKRLSAEIQAGTKTTVTVDVTPVQLEALAQQVGLDPNSAFWSYLTRRYIDQLYNMLIAAGATLDITTKAANADDEFWGFKHRTTPDNHTPFWPIHPTKEGKP